MKLRAASIAFLTFLIPATLPAAVVDSTAGGFTVKTTLAVKAGPNTVYRNIIENVGSWWDPAHTFSHNAANLSIEPNPMGCFCEKLPGQGFVRHMEVIYLEPEKAIVMTGAIGPLQAFATTGTMTITMGPTDGGTKVEITYTVGGYMPAGLNTMATPVDGVIANQFQRLKNFIETGKP